MPTLPSVFALASAGVAVAARVAVATGTFSGTGASARRVGVGVGAPTRRRRSAVAMLDERTFVRLGTIVFPKASVTYMSNDAVVKAALRTMLKTLTVSSELVYVVRLNLITMGCAEAAVFKPAGPQLFIRKVCGFALLVSLGFPVFRMPDRPTKEWDVVVVVYELALQIVPGAQNVGQPSSA